MNLEPVSLSTGSSHTCPTSLHGDERYAIILLKIALPALFTAFEFRTNCKRGAPRCLGILGSRNLPSFIPGERVGTTELLSVTIGCKLPELEVG